MARTGNIKLVFRVKFTPQIKIMMAEKIRYLLLITLFGIDFIVNVYHPSRVIFY